MIVLTDRSKGRRLEAFDEADAVQQLMELRDISMYRLPTGQWQADRLNPPYTPTAVSLGTKEECEAGVLRYLHLSGCWKMEPPPFFHRPTLWYRILNFIEIDVIGWFEDILSSRSGRAGPGTSSVPSLTGSSPAKLPAPTSTGTLLQGALNVVKILKRE